MGAEKADPLSARGIGLLHSGLDEHMDVFRRLATLAPGIQ
jgi:hypothetical protein